MAVPKSSKGVPIPKKGNLNRKPSSLTKKSAKGLMNARPDTKNSQAPTTKFPFKKKGVN